MRRWNRMRETSLDVARYPLKTYATRIELEDGSSDAGCSNCLLTRRASSCRCISARSPRSNRYSF